ncbi:MAG TPA: hypothetical protein VKH37_09635 [Ferruginibacter sp.]|nr:hypothetical protein [Ferruginibacter sp.]
MAEKKWVITLSGDRPIAEVKKDITALGFKVEQLLSEIGSITGSATETVVKKIRSKAGIADVSEDSDINLGPPDAPVTW